MPEIVESELIVVGVGPGGYAAAFLAADKGMRVPSLHPRSTSAASAATG